MKAPEIRVARIIGTEIIVGTIHRLAPHAFTRDTLFPRSTRIAVVTEKPIIKMNAPHLGVTSIIGTRVVVVAIEFSPALAPALGTRILRGAGILVITGSVVGGKGTAHLGVTRIVGAQVAVVAGELAAADALAQVTVVAISTDVLVVTGGLVEQVETPLNRVTGIVGARVVIVATLLLRGHAFPLAAVVIEGA